jgi:SAM-dependent methyltransferase
MDARTETVRRFYDAAPFPGYPPRDNLQALRARADRNPFVRLLDEAIAGDARVVEVGCGTGQMCLYLARADRIVVGMDLSRAALRLGAEAARRFGVGGVQFVESDLRNPGVRAGAFDVVYSSGVLHHTADPRASFAGLVRLVRPGGAVVLGLYNAFARVPTRLRRAIARLTAFRAVPFDPVLRERAAEPGAPRRLAARSVSAPRRARAYDRRGAGVVRGERGRVSADLSERRVRRPARRALHAGARQLACRRMALTARLDAHARPRRGLFFTIGRRT